MIDEHLAQAIFGDISVHTLPGEGITRPSYSETETEAMLVVKRYAEVFGLTTNWDIAGNLHVSLERPTDTLRITGSHVDSVQNGGRYDGVAGVVAGLLALDKARHCDFRGPELRLIVMRGEESAWFGKPHLGSRALFGLLDETDAQRMRTDGMQLAGCMDRVLSSTRPRLVFDGKRILDPATIGMFVEVHIEQGPVLHDRDERIAVVDSIAGSYRYRDCKVIGAAGHSGTVPRHLRRDALMAFTELMQRLELGSDGFNDTELRFTCGVAGTNPSRHGITSIPDEVSFSFEFRGPDTSLLEMFNRFVQTATGAVCEQRKVQIELPDPVITKPVKLDEALVRVLRGACADGHAPAVVMPSGAGHDAAIFQQQGVPSGMIFIRNEHGSHNPKESMRMGDFLVATEALYRVLTSKRD